MVDYHGPEVFRKSLERFNVHMFDRIQEIGFSVRDPQKIQLDQEETARLPELEKISIWKRWGTKVSESDVNAAEEVVSECQLASIHQNESQIELKSFSCCD